MFCGSAKVMAIKVPPNIFHLQCREDLVVCTFQHISCRCNCQRLQVPCLDNFSTSHTMASFSKKYYQRQAHWSLINSSVRHLAGNVSEPFKDTLHMWKGLYVQAFSWPDLDISQHTLSHWSSAQSKMGFTFIPLFDKLSKLQRPFGSAVY